MSRGKGSWLEPVWEFFCDVLLAGLLGAMASIAYYLLSAIGDAIRSLGRRK